MVDGAAAGIALYQSGKSIVNGNQRRVGSASDEKTLIFPRDLLRQRLRAKQILTRMVWI
jgi:hypothetical protein